MTTDYRSASLWILALVLGGALASSALATQPPDFRTTAGDYSVYLAVMPTEFITGPKSAPEPGATPFRPAAAKDTHHVMVSIFEYRTGRRLTDAAVDARVAGLGFSGEKKALEPTAVAGAAAFANSFPMIGRGPFRVDVEFRVPGAARAEHATFYFTHPSFEPPAGGTREDRKP